MSITPQVAMMLAQAFKGLGKKETAENLKDGFGSLASQAGQQGMDKMIEFMNVAEAKSPALSVLTAQIQAGTTEERIELMKSLLELLQSDTAQLGISLLIQVLNKIISMIADMVDFVNTDLSMPPPDAQMPENQMTGSGTAPASPNATWWERMTEAIRNAFSGGRGGGNPF